MKHATFTEVRNHAKQYFDIVESGGSVRVLRNGKPIAEIIPVQAWDYSWKKTTTPLAIKGLLLSKEILKDRLTA